FRIARAACHQGEMVMHSARFFATILLTTSAFPAFATPPHTAHQIPILMRAPMAQLHAAKAVAKQSANSVRPHSLPDTFTILDAPGAGTTSGQGTTAIFVDNSGRTTGYYADSDNNYHTFFRAADGTYTAPIDIDGPASVTIAHWANDKGSITGDYFDSGLS